jgi:hypothetical protein
MAQQFKDEVLYDVRLLERHVARGLLTREAITKRREASPDLTDHCEKLDVDQLGRNSAAKRPRK